MKKHYLFIIIIALFTISCTPRPPLILHSLPNEYNKICALKRQNSPNDFWEIYILSVDGHSTGDVGFFLSPDGHIEIEAGKHRIKYKCIGTMMKKGGAKSDFSTLKRGYITLDFEGGYRYTLGGNRFTYTPEIVSKTPLKF